MSGETEKAVSGWTVDTLNAHLEQILEERDKRYGQRFAASQEALQAALVAQEKAVAAALSAADRAVQKAETASEKRFDSVNEFRAALSDATTRLMPRSEVEALVRSLNERVDVQIGSLSEKIEGNRRQIDRMADTSKGETQALSGAWQVALGIGALVAAVATIIWTVHVITGK